MQKFDKLLRIVAKYIVKQTGKKPVILPVIIEI